MEYHLYGDQPYEEVEQFVTAALEKALEEGSQPGLSLCYHALGAVQYLMGKWQESIASYERSIDLGAGRGTFRSGSWVTTASPGGN